MRMPLPLFESILRLFRRPAKAKAEPRVMWNERFNESYVKTWNRLISDGELFDRGFSSKEEFYRRNPQLAELENELERDRPKPEPVAASPDLTLLLANGRAAAERQQQILGDPTKPPAKPQPTKFTYRCGWCLQPFHREPETPGDLEKLRQVLLITGYPLTASIDIFDPRYGNAVA